MSVHDLVLFSILGLGTGAIIAALAVGLILIHKGSGVINIGTGATAMLGAYCFWALTTGALGFTVSKPIAFLITVVFVNVLGLATELLVFRPLRTSSPVARLVASLGILVGAEAAMMLAFGSFTKTEPSILPSSDVRVFSIDVPACYFILTGYIIVVTAGLTWFYKKSKFGLATNAAFENERAASWLGVNPSRVALANTLIASTLIGVTSILIAPVISVDPINMPLLVVPGVVAAVFANFTSLPIACLVGLCMGAAENILYYFSSQSWFPTSRGIPLPGVWELFVFVTMVIAVTLRGSRLPTRGEVIERPLPPVPEPRHISRYFWRVLFVGAIALVVLPYDFRQALTNSIVGAVMISSLIVITGYVGQVSVVQLALSGVSAFTMAHLAQSYNLAFPLPELMGIATATAVGMIIGASALRIRGIQLAIVSLAAASALDRFWFGNTVLGAGLEGTPVADPHVFGVDIGFGAHFRGLSGGLPSPVLGILILFGACLSCAYVAHLRRTRLGQQMVVVRSNERAAASIGINVRNVKLLAFLISSILAGLGGVMYALNFRSVSEYSFDVTPGLQILSLAYIGGITMISGAAYGGLVTVEALFPYAWQKWFGLSGNWALLIGGVGLVFNLIYLPAGVAGHKRKLEEQRAERERRGLKPRRRFGPYGLAVAAVERGGNAIRHKRSAV